MNYFDYIIIVLYLLIFLWLGKRFSSSGSSSDYFLGGKSFGWASLSISTAATQLSAISFVSAPAFVGLKDGGGMMWLTYEFAVPVAMLFLMAYLIPPLFKAKIISVYEYLENRFGRSTRLLLSGVFQISRAFATSIMIYTIALILTSVMDIPMWQTILMIGLITMVYTLMGGMKAVVYGDVIQMGILVVGIVICLGYGIHYLGGWNNFIAQVDSERLTVVDFGNLGIKEGEGFGFWPMLIGGFFLYASYYGTDQNQVQRLFSAPDQKTLNKTLLANGLLRFPITLTYCIMGLVLGTLVLQDPSYKAAIPVDDPDLMVPIFIRDYLPHGIIGLLMVAIFSAAMSSLSSAINSLSAASVEDFFNSNKQLSNKKYVSFSRRSSLFWGVVCIVLAFYTGEIADTVIEAINKIGSVFYGPMLATFIVAIGLRKVHGQAINIGILSGVGINIYLWLFVPSVFWFWWNAVGAIVTIGVAVLISLLWPKPDQTTPALKTEVKVPNEWKKFLLLLIFFFFIVAFSVYLPNFFR